MSPHATRRTRRSALPSPRGNPGSSAWIWKLYAFFAAAGLSAAAAVAVETGVVRSAPANPLRAGRQEEDVSALPEKRPAATASPPAAPGHAPATEASPPPAGETVGNDAPPAATGALPGQLPGAAPRLLSAPDERRDTSPPPVQTAPETAGEPFHPSSLPPADASPPPAALPALLDMAFWLEWGGGAGQPWQGAVQLDQGALLTARPFGLSADEPGSMYLEQDRLTIAPRTPRVFDSVLLRARAPRDARLQIQLGAAGGRLQQVSIPLADILDKSHTTRLDERGNRLIARRAAGDRLRIRTHRRSLVFDPGEPFEFFVQPNLLDRPTAGRRCRVELARARGSSVLWTDEQPVVFAADGSASPVGPFRVAMPRAEGAYDLTVSLAGDQQPAGSEPPWRKMQVVVVAGSTAPPLDAASPQQDGWQVVQDVDPTDLPAAASHGGRLERVVDLDQTVLEISPQGWLAIPLTVTAVGRPHVVEISVPNHREQTLGTAIIQHDDVRRGPAPTLDAGLDTPFAAPHLAPAMEAHVFTFWPQSTTPTLLLTNRRADQTATVGRIRVVAGPQALPPPAAASQSRRLLAAYLEDPRLAELFGASSTVDPQSGRVLQDWETFYQAGQRLVARLSLAGYNSAVLPVVYHGGALYPSQRLQPTPRYDNGVFFATGQDPLRKDVLEMLLRMFDRAGMKLVPAIRFTGTLPELEAWRRQGEPRDAADAADPPLTPPAEAPHGIGAHYNPLDPAVATAMRGVVGELLDRCAEHPSFAGLAIQLDPHSYAAFADAAGGRSPQVEDRFRADTGTPSGEDAVGDPPPPPPQQQQQQWLQWRAEQLAQLYHGMAADVTGAREDARLFLVDAGLLAGSGVDDLFRGDRFPSGIGPQEVLLHHGIDPRQYRQAGIVLLRPRRLQPQAPELLDAELAWSRQLDALFPAAPGEGAGSVFHHPPQQLTLASWRPAGASGRSEPLRLASRIAPAGQHNLRHFTHCLAAADAQVIFDAGWFAPRDPRGWRQFASAYASLPPVAFQTVAPAGEAPTQPVTLRSLAQSDRTLLYLANNSTWSVRTAIVFRAAAPFELESLCQRQLPPPVFQTQQATWSVELAPFETVAFALSSSDVEVAGWETEVGPEVLDALIQGIEALRARGKARRAYAVLANPGFDHPPQEAGLPGWVHAQGAGRHVDVATEQTQDGGQALRLRSSTPSQWSRGPTVWLRSDPFDAPASGRLVFGTWLKIADEARQPRVRMVIEGTYRGRRFQHFRDLGASDEGGPTTPLGRAWTYHALSVDQLALEGIEDLRVGVDLRGRGEVWIDSVELLDVALDDREREELGRTLVTAAAHLERGAVSDCLALLKSHQAQFLFRQFPAAAASAGDSEPARPQPTRPQPAEAAPVEAAPVEAARPGTPEAAPGEPLSRATLLRELPRAAAEPPYDSPLAVDTPFAADPRPRWRVSDQLPRRAAEAETAAEPPSSRSWIERLRATLPLRGNPPATTRR